MGIAYFRFCSYRMESKTSETYNPLGRNQTYEIDQRKPDGTLALSFSSQQYDPANAG